MKLPFTKQTIASRIVGMFCGLDADIESRMVNRLLEMSDYRFLINARKSTGLDIVQGAPGWYFIRYDF